MVRHSPNVEGYVALTNKKGDRTEIKVNVPNEFVKILRTPANWETLYKDNKVRLRTCIATSGSKWAVEGERVFELILWNNQKIRLDKGDLTRRRVDNIISAINKKLHTGY